MKRKEELTSKQELKAYTINYPSCIELKIIDDKLYLKIQKEFRVDAIGEAVIRVQLSDIGNPIIGDKKYHSTSNPLKRLGLHASLIEYTEKGKVYHFETKYPKEFTKLFKNV